MKRGLFTVPIKNRDLATTTGGSREDALGSAGGYKLQAVSCNHRYGRGDSDRKREIGALVGY